VSLTDRLKAAATQPDARRKRESHPSGFEPGVAYEAGQPASVTLRFAEQTPDESQWREEIKRVTGLTVPDDREVQLKDVRFWGNQAEPYVYCRFVIIPRTRFADPADLEALVKIAKGRVTKKPVDGGDHAFVFAIGDTQLGKTDGDGTEGTVQRVIDSFARAVSRVRELRRMGRSIGPIYLCWLGDHIEGQNSQGGGLIWRTDLTITEMNRLFRRLVMEQVKMFAPLTDELIVAGIPGNHGEPLRIAGKMASRYDDSWDTEALMQAADAFALAGGYEHVKFITPGHDELTLTLDMAGTITTLAHGHKWRPGKAMDWWANQAHGMQAAGDSTLLLSGHLHHLRVEQGGCKTWIQVPAMDGGSKWWTHATGQDSPPGAVTLVVGDGGWTDPLVI